MSPPGRSGSGTAGDNNWREQPYRPTTGSVLVNAVHGNKLLTVTLAPPHSFGRPRSGSARRVVKCRRARSQLGTRQRFTRSNESDRNLVLQRVLGQFPLLAPLTQFLGRLLLVGAQFGEEADVNLVDWRVRVLALVVLHKQARGPARHLGEVRAGGALVDHPAHPVPPVLQRLHARVAVPGHSPVVRSLAIGGHRVLVFLGRTHLYEGHPVQTVVHGVRTAVAAGCRIVVLTNAAGGIRAGYQVGQPVLIRDHLNLTARSPLTGSPPPDGYPSRFTDLTGLYSPRLRELAHRAEPGLTEGVYAALPGPHYETPAEITMLRGLGADLVGMSTVLEAIAARHLGAEVLAISLVTNLAAGLAPSGLDHQEVIAAGRAASARMGSLLAAILPGIG